MTTGRINQVTFLNPRRLWKQNRLEHPQQRERSWLLQGRSARRRSVGCVLPAKLQEPPPTIQLPPLNFLKSGPLQTQSGVIAAVHCCMRTSSGGNLFSVTPKGGY